MFDLRSLRRSLVLKVAGLTVLFVLALSSIAAVVIGALITRVHQDAGAHRAAEFAKMVPPALARLTGDAHGAVQHHLSDLCEAADRSAFITTADGQVAFACEPSMIGAAITPGTTSGDLLAHGGRTWARWVGPIENGPDCRGCHAASTGALGYLGVDVPMDESKEEVREQQELNLAAGLVLAAVLCVLLVSVHILLVYRPLRELVGTVERIRAGDLSARTQAVRRDEIGDLALSLNDMAISLEQAKTELARTHRAELAQSEKLAALGQLFSSVSHEIKNQLAGLVGAVRVLEADFPEGDSHKPVLGKLLSHMERMSHTAVAALEFAKPLKQAEEPVDVNALLERTLFFVERQATEQGVTLRKRYAPDLPRARVDEDLMKQVFLNILLNGIQAMPNGGALEVQTQVFGPRGVEVIISDQGVGIAQENLARIFSPFFTTRARGTGLGLYVARQIVETQRGELHVSSTVGQGTSFTVRLPIDAATEGA